MSAKPHQFRCLPRGKKSSVSIPWWVCAGCGLVWLKNKATEKAVKAPCPGNGD